MNYKVGGRGAGEVMWTTNLSNDSAQQSPNALPFISQFSIHIL